MINGKTIAMSSEMLKKNILDTSRPIDFDVSVNAQRQTPHRTNYQNDFAIMLLKSGIINAGEALELMTFEGKDKVLKSVQARFDMETQMKLDEAAKLIES